MRGPNFITIHSTGNAKAGANALMHARWIKTGKEADGRDILAGWHFTVDDNEIIYQHLPLTEIGWHAGDGSDGTGNRESIGIEICENVDGDLQKAIANAAWLTAKLMKDFNLGIDRVRQHYHWSGKNCPRILRDKPGGWEDFLKQVRGADEMLEKAIVINSVADFAAAELLAVRLNAPIFFRRAMGQLKAKEVYVIGGGVAGVPGGNVIDLSGIDRLETAVKVYEWCKKNVAP